MDYRALLEKYIDHVRQCEGTAFLSRFERDDSEVIFSNSEWQELCVLEADIHPPVNRVHTSKQRGPDFTHLVTSDEVD